MHDLLKGVEAVGFDLDGTLYQLTPEINDRVRNRIAERILERKPELQSVVEARKYFEERYKEVGSGTGALAESGYSNPSLIMDQCLAEADVLDLINPDPTLKSTLEEISRRFTTYLITASPRELALQKLGRIGIDPNLFAYTSFSDSPGAGHKSEGTPFKRILKETNIPADRHLYIGDRLKSDVIPAKGLGMKIAAVWSEIPQADISIPHIHEIRGLLLNGR